jgi:hypothetical protein
MGAEDSLPDRQVSYSKYRKHGLRLDLTYDFRDNCDEFCLSKIVNGTAKDCDDCMFQFQAGMLDSKYGDRRISEQSFTSLLSSCGVNPSDYPHSTPTLDPIPP